MALSTSNGHARAASPDSRDAREVRLVAGALAYTRYNLATRLMMKWIAWREGGNIDTSRDHEYTDWDQLRRDVELFAMRIVPKPAPLPVEAEAEDPVGIFAGAGI